MKTYEVFPALKGEDYQSALLKFEEKFETYQKELELLEGADRVQVLVELARIATEDVFKFNEAVTWWRKLLDVSPGDQRAIAAL